MNPLAIDPLSTFGMPLVDLVHLLLAAHSLAVLAAGADYLADYLADAAAIGVSLLAPGRWHAAPGPDSTSARSPPTHPATRPSPR